MICGLDALLFYMENMWVVVRARKDNKLVLHLVEFFKKLGVQLCHKLLIL